MLEKPQDCVGCSLWEKGTGFIRPEGRCTNRVLLVGEGGGWTEAQEGLPFRPQAEAGSMLERCFRLAKVERDQFGLWNCIGCQPPGNWLDGAPWEVSAINHCSKYFERVVATYQPKCIVALGNVPFRMLTGQGGKNKGIQMMRGYVFESKYGPVVAALHPSFIRKGNAQYAVTLVHDLRKAVQIALGLFTAYDFHKDYREPKYQEYPSLDDARSYFFRVKDNLRLPLAYDLETLSSQDLEEDELDEIEENTVTQIQFSLEPKTGICFPWKGEYIDIARAIFKRENVKYGHNVWDFDNPILKAQEVEIAGVIHDTMWMWHHLWSDLDKGLQKVVSFHGFPFPWKHLASVPGRKAFYGIADVDAVQYIIHSLPQQMKEKGVWNGYERQVAGLKPVLSRAEERGICVDAEGREAFTKTVVKVIERTDSELQELIPDSQKNIDPPQGYKKVPVWVREAIHRYEAMAKEWRAKYGTEPLELHKWLKKKFGLVRREVDIENPPLFAEGESKFVKDERWAIQLKFKPSKDQVVSYIKYMREKGGKGWRNYVVPMTFREERETTAKGEILRLALTTGDPVFSKIVELREYSKMLGTDIKNWEPGADGKVHTTFTFGPATGQLSSRRPNVQNAPKNADLADAFRAMIVPSPGCVLVEVDFSGFHARMVGRESQDLSYYHLAGIDIHSFLASYLEQVNQPVPLEPHRLGDASYRAELADRLAYIKKNFKSVRDEIAKKTILGWGFGMGYRKAFFLYRDSYKTESVARATFEMLERLFERATAWRMEVRKKAHVQTFELSNWGFIRYFFEVFRNKKVGAKWVLVPGLDSEKAIAFLPANHAFGMIRSVMLRLEKAGANARYGFVNNVHDSLVFDCPEKWVNECIGATYKLMTKPCATLADPVVCPEGFQVGVGVSIGKNWSKRVMKELSKEETRMVVEGKAEWREYV